MPYAMESFARLFQCSETKSGNGIHNSFPLGIHPVGQMLSRAAEESGMSVAWVGAGTAAPSVVQLQLIEMLKPTVWMGMSSFGQHLANLADSMEKPVEGSTVERIFCSAEPLTKSKRDKLERSWGAEVFDCFGMTEVTLIGAESPAHDGFHIWTDMAYIEILDEETFEPVPPGTPGLLIVTPFFTNHVTPFLRWNSGDIVVYKDEGDWDGPFSVFPVMSHEHRTAGFFKVRGVNINHTEFEDFMFARVDVNEFKVEALSVDDIDKMVISLEIKSGSDEKSVIESLTNEVKNTFEVTAEITVLEAGTLIEEFAKSVKAQRFVDSRA
ncbi:MAG: AMP-binding protein [Alphaproteobacteria bacterium]|nr:AMP-binding protein [Alphaproteobacteria bacterium]